jgi:hypothetical protein
VKFLSHAPDRGSDLVAKGTKSGGAGNMPLVRSLELSRKPVWPIERVLKVGAAHQPDALALVVKGGPVRLELTIWNEILELDKTRRPSRPFESSWADAIAPRNAAWTSVFG